jgi:hypothetical protein
MWIGQIVLALAVALDARMRRFRAGGLWHNEDGDMGGAQQIALAAVGIAIIVGVLMPMLSSGMGAAVSRMLARLTGI